MNIYDIPRADVTDLLYDNYGIIPLNIYQEAWNLIQSGNIEEASGSITDWIIAYNLLQTSIFIDTYKVSDILTIPDDNLIDLAGNLQLPSVDKERIIRILSYLNKLDSDMSIFDALSDDILSLILQHLDCISILLMCKMSKRLNNFGHSTKLIPILSEKLRMNLKGYTLEDIGRICEKRPRIPPIRGFEI